MRVFLVILLLAAIVGAASCSAQRSEQCTSICEREAECAEEHAADGFKFDKGECLAACTALERKADGETKVIEHRDCVRRASDCRAVFACK